MASHRLEAGFVTVRGTLARVRGERRWIVTEPKTRASKAKVSLSTEMLKGLKRWNAEQAAMRLKIGSEWQDHGLVFTTEFGSPLGNNMRRAWDRVLRVADGGKGDLGTWGIEAEKPRSGPTPERPFEPRFSMYVLRHTRLTLMVDTGIPLSVVSKHARHKKVAITVQFYVHSEVANTKRPAEESFSRLLASAAS